MDGIQLKERGQQLALSNAGDAWLEKTIDRLKAFCKARKELGYPRFRLEEFREVGIKQGWEQPPSSNAYGALPRIAMRMGLIEFTGQYENAQSPKTRSHPVKIWEVR